MKPKHAQRAQDTLLDDGIVFVVATPATADQPASARVRLRRFPAVERRGELVDLLTAATTRCLDAPNGTQRDPDSVSEAIRTELAALVHGRVELRPTIFVLVLGP